MAEKNNWRRRSLWRRKCDAYFAGCDEAGRRYTVAGLRLALGADGKRWQELTSDPQLRDIFDLALARIRDCLEQREDQMAVNLLKRPEYGGGGAGAEPLRVRVVFGDGEELSAYGG